ncbi:MAG TPA: MBL fold metallo-hydrolase [Anaerolineae bacterium]|nr:MBL fold metallo-hydrolase [Anaerolineae bacterium]
MASRIRVFTSALYLTTSGVVRGSSGTLVIDPNLLPREIETLRWYVEQSGTPAKYLVYTHHHWDHILGGQAFPGARRLAQRGFPAAVRAAQAEAAIHRFDAEYYLFREPPFEFQPPHELVDDGWAGELGDVEFRLLHLPGHAPDMLGVHLPAEQTLFAADMLSDIELPMIEGDGGDYLASLRKVDALVASGQVETLIPGHGRVTHGADAIRARIAEDIAYLDRLRIVIGGQLGEGVDEASTVAACQSMDYRGKAGWPPMQRAHEENVREIYKALAVG